MEPLPFVFPAFQYLGDILPLIASLRCALQDDVYIMGCSTAGGLWPTWPPSWILPKIKIYQKTAEIEIF